MTAPALSDASRRWGLPGYVRERMRANFGDKLTGAVVAIGLELLLLLALLTIGEMQLNPHKDVPLAAVTFDSREYSETPHQPEPKPATKAARARPRMTQPRSTPQAQVAQVQPPAAIIPVSPQQMRSFDISNLPKRPNAPVGPIGPAFTPAFGDSKQVGNAPNGAPMYAAAWYREPTDQELAGYLSTARGPGWALITCKTVADYRVEDCVGLGEYPDDSQMLRAVLAAAWQFRVRPPRVGGVAQVGDWVRIRISYEETPRSRYGDPGGQ
jgi:protein TonB